ncbi:hypothetical protein [Bacillus sp. FSL K6-3431]|uniref:hypothetical protein n=1 Tax=Bacillus sp. FSL K6-3431 TaxID=2921500 RepID=UPI0030FCE0FF
MNKILLVLLLGLTLVLGACGSDTVKISGGDKKPKEESAKEAEKDKEVPEEVKKEAETENENVQEDDDLKATNTFTNKELGITGEVGPMKYEISGIQLKELEPKTQETADMFEVEIGDKVHVITIALSGENTSEEDMTFYLGQATIITNTKEQLEPDMILSEYIEGDYLGQVEHEGFNVYILNKSTVKDLESIEIRISAPTDSGFETVGEDIKHVIEVNK